MRKFVIAIGFATVLSGSALWGQPQPAQRTTDGEYQKAYAEAYEKSLRSAFRTSSVEQCVSSARKAAAAGYDVTPTCTCAADTILKTHTVDQLEELSVEALEPVTSQCLKTHPPLLSSKR